MADGVRVVYERKTDEELERGMTERWEEAAKWQTPRQVILSLGDWRERLPTGFEEIDTRTRGGLPKASLTIIMGPPESCKTTMASQMAVDMTLKHSLFCVGIFEDEGVQAAAIRIGQQAFGLDREKLESSDKETADALTPLDERLWLPDPSRPFEEIMDEAIKRAEGRPILVIIDSLQTITSSTWGENEGSTSGLEKLIKSIRRYTTKHGLRVIATAEVNRGAYSSRKESERVSKLSAGAGSRKIEFGAELLISLEGSPEDGIKAEILKNRVGGKRGHFAFTFNPVRARLNPASLAELLQKDEAAKAWDRDLKINGVMSELVELVTRHPGLSGNEIEKELGGKAEIVRAARSKAKFEEKIHDRKRQGKGGGIGWYPGAGTSSPEDRDFDSHKTLAGNFVEPRLAPTGAKTGRGSEASTANRVLTSSGTRLDEVGRGSVPHPRSSLNLSPENLGELRRTSEETGEADDPEPATVFQIRDQSSDSVGADEESF